MRFNLKTKQYFHCKNHSEITSQTPCTGNQHIYSYAINKVALRESRDITTVLRGLRQGQLGHNLGKLQSAKQQSATKLTLAKLVF